MSDLISRSKLIHDLKEWLNVLEYDMNKGEYSELCINQGEREAVKQIIQDVTEMPSTNGWIRCTDRLPEETGSYLVNIHQEDDEIGDSGDIVLNAWYQKNELLYAPIEVGWTLSNE